MEVESNGMLPFLGIQLLNRSPRVETKVYVKPKVCDHVWKTSVRFSWYKGAGSTQLYLLAKSGGKTENYAIITQGQWELEFPNLIAEEGNSELNGTIFYITFSMFYKKKRSGHS